MSNLHPHLVVQHERDVIIAGFTRADLLDRTFLEDAQAELEAMVRDSDAPLIVLSFRGVEFINSRAVGMTARLHSVSQRHGGRLAVAEVNESIMEVFHLCRLDRVLTMCDTVEDAVAALSRDGEASS